MSKITAIALLLILISVRPTFSFGWQDSSPIYHYTFVSRLTSKIVNDQRVLVSKQETVSNTIVKVASFAKENHTVYYFIEQAETGAQFILLGKNYSPFTNITYNASTILIDDKPNFDYEMNYKVVQHVENGERRSYLTFFAITFLPLFFIEPHWDFYKTNLKNWFLFQESLWSAYSFAQTYVFSLSARQNKISIIASFPYVQSVYIGYVPNSFEGLFGTLSNYVDAEGTISQEIDLEYDYDNGLLKSFSSILLIDLPGKVSVKAENEIRLSSVHTKANYTSLIIFITTVTLVILVAIVILFRKHLLTLIKRIPKVKVKKR